MTKILNQFYRLLASYGLACVILILLFVLTLLGTLEQTHIGLYEAQKRYFESFFVLYPLPWGFGLPLPGGYLMMILLAINLTLGGIMRYRGGRVTFGLLIVHGGILFMLLGALITHEFALEGQMTLTPGEPSSEFQSYNTWELAIVDTSGPKENTEYIIPMKDFAHLGGGRGRTFFSPGLPFEVTLGGFARNARVQPKEANIEAPSEVIGGFYVGELPLDPQIERNAPALYLTIRDKKTGVARREILWGFAVAPLSFVSGGKTWDVSLRHEKWPMPFAVTLKKFTREYHPGTEIPRTYQSELIKTEGSGRQAVTIRMNEPLRHRGYTLFQSSFIDPSRQGDSGGDHGADQGTDHFLSVLAVVRNPADQFPLWACYIITLGLLVHFSSRLFRHLKRERAKQA